MPCMLGKFEGHGWRYCGSSMANIRHWVIEDQTHFGIARGAIMSFALNELYELNGLLLVQS